MIAQLEKDLVSVVKAIEQAFANVNILQGQKQGLEHAITTIKNAASATETVATVVEDVANAAEASAAPVEATPTATGETV